MSRREFTRKQRAEIILRSRNAAGDICCEGCSLVLAGKPFEVDHILPEALADKTKPLTAEDGWLLGKACCHTPKTGDDIRRIRKADRQRDRASGAIVAKQKIRSAGFPRRREARPKPPLQPKTLFWAVGQNFEEYD